MLLEDHLVVDEIVERNSDMMDEIRQSCVIVGLLIVRVTIGESPSKMKD